VACNEANTAGASLLADGKGMLQERATVKLFEELGRTEAL
jgi:hypothetical protein